MSLPLSMNSMEVLVACTVLVVCELWRLAHCKRNTQFEEISVLSGLDTIYSAQHLVHSAWLFWELSRYGDCESIVVRLRSSPEENHRESQLQRNACRPCQSVQTSYDLLYISVKDRLYVEPSNHHKKTPNSQALTTRAWTRLGKVDPAITRVLEYLPITPRLPHSARDVQNVLLPHSSRQL